MGEGEGAWNAHNEQTNKTTDAHEESNANAREGIEI